MSLVSIPALLLILLGTLSTLRFVFIDDLRTQLQHAKEERAEIVRKQEMFRQERDKYRCEVQNQKESRSFYYPTIIMLYRFIHCYCNDEDVDGGRRHIIDRLNNYDNNNQNSVYIILTTELMKDLLQHVKSCQQSYSDTDVKNEAAHQVGLVCYYKIYSSDINCVSL